MVFCFITPTYSSDMLRSHKCWFISTTTTENGQKLFECEFKEHDKSLTPKISSFYSNKIFHLEPFLAFFSLSCFLFKKSISRTSYTTVMEWWKGSRYIIIFFWAFGWLCTLHNNKYICWIKCLGIFIVLVMMGSCYWVELFEYFALLVFLRLDVYTKIEMSCSIIVSEVALQTKTFDLMFSVMILTWILC